MKKTIFITALIAFTSLFSLAQTVDEIVNKNIKALGGKEKLNSLKSVKTEATISVQGQELPTTMTQLNNVGMRSEFKVQGMTGIQVLTQNDGWSFMPFMGHDKAVATAEDEVKQSKDDLDLSGHLVDYIAKGNKIELVGTENIEGKETHHLKIKTKSGNVMDYFFDASTGHIVKTISKRKMNGQEAEVSVILSDYKSTGDGYVFPYTINQTIPGPGSMVIKISKIEINQPVDETIFDMP